DLGNDEVFDRTEHHLFDVDLGDLLLDKVPQPGRPFLGQNKEELDRLFNRPDDFFAGDLDRDPANVVVRQPEDLKDQTQDAFEVEALRHGDTCFTQRAEQPAHQPFLEMAGDVADEL